MENAKNKIIAAITLLCIIFFTSNTSLATETTSDFSDAEVIAWAKEAGEATFSYNFNNYEEAMQDMVKYFTNTGWQSFSAALKASNNLKAIKQDKLNLSAVITAEPTINKKDTVDGDPTWEVTMPIEVTYQSPKAAHTAEFNLVLAIETKNGDGEDGAKALGISQIIATPNVPRPKKK